MKCHAFTFQPSGSPLKPRHHPLAWSWTPKQRPLRGVRCLQRQAPTFRCLRVIWAARWALGTDRGTWMPVLSLGLGAKSQRETPGSRSSGAVLKGLQPCPPQSTFFCSNKAFQCQGQLSSHPYTLLLVQTDAKLSDSERQGSLRAS